MDDIRVVSLRLPEQLHAWIRQVAAESRRSVNSELIVRLERARQQEQEQTTAQKR